MRHVQPYPISKPANWLPRPLPQPPPAPAKRLGLLDEFYLRVSDDIFRILASWSSANAGLPEAGYVNG